MGITASLSRRRYARHPENAEAQELEKLEKVKKKVIRKPRPELILLLEVVLERAMKDGKDKIISSFMDPVFIREIVFKLSVDYVESFTDLLSLIVKKTRQNEEKLPQLIEQAIFLHSDSLPDDAYNRLQELDLSNTAIYLLNNHTHSNLQVLEDDLDVVKIVSALSRQEFMDDIQQGRFTAFISRNSEKIRSEFESVLSRTSPIQLRLILERLDFIDAVIVRQITNYFNQQVEDYDIQYRDLRQSSQYVRSFITSPTAEQWIDCFRLFLEGENKNELVSGLSLCKPEYRSIADHIISHLDH